MLESDFQEKEFRWLSQFKEIVLANLSDSSLTNELLATKLSISTRTLYRIIQKHTGQTPNHYLRNIRLEQAYDLLNAGSYVTVKEVVAKVGFKKVHYFSTLFKAKYGMNPVEVLKKNGLK